MGETGLCHAFHMSRGKAGLLLHRVLYCIVILRFVSHNENRMNIRKAVRLTPSEKGFCLNNPNMSLSDRGCSGSYRIGRTMEKGKEGAKTKEKMKDIV